MNKDEQTLAIGMTVTKCYKTSDGEVFEDFDAANQHQVRYNFCENLASHFDTLHLSRDDIAVITDGIMNDLDGIAEVFEFYLEQRG